MPHWLPFLLLLLVGALVFAVIAFTGASEKIVRIIAFFAFVTVAYCSYRLGKFDGREIYYGALREELSPLLRKLVEVSKAQQRAAVDDFFLGASEIKTDATEYLASLRHANALMQKWPNQPSEPTAMSVTPPAAQEPRQP